MLQHNVLCNLKHTNELQIFSTHPYKYPYMYKTYICKTLQGVSWNEGNFEWELGYFQDN